MDEFRKNKEGNRFSDFFTNLTVHPDTKQILRKVDAEAVKQSIKNLLLTDIYERPFSNIGSNIRKTLFENITPQNSITIKKFIENCIENFEPRVKITNILVKASPDENAYMVNIQYLIINGSAPTSLALTLKRVR